MTFVLAFGTLPDMVSAEEEEAINVTINFQQSDSGFEVARQDFTITPGLAAEYGYADDADVGVDEVTALDALVAAHISIFGDDEAAVNDALELNSSGYLTRIMGETTSNFLFYVNGEMPNDGVLAEYPGWDPQYTGYSVGQAVLHDGDIVEYFMLQDSYAMDMYAWFESGGEKVESFTAEAGESFDLTVSGYMGMFYGLCDSETLEGYIEPIEDAAIVPVEIDAGAGIFGAPLGTTNENGVVTLSFDEEGDYIFSAVDDSGYAPLMSPWLAVHVEDGGGTGGSPEDIHAEVQSIVVRTADGSADAETIEEDTAYTVQVTVKNTGEGPVNPSVAVYEVRDDTVAALLGNEVQSAGELDPEDSATLDFIWTPVTAGACTLRAFVSADVEGTSTELDRLEHAVTVTADPNVIVVNTAYGAGKLNKITITGAEVINSTRRVDSETGHIVYDVLLDAGTAMDTMVSAVFEFTQNKGYPAAAPICSTDVPGQALTVIVNAITDTYSATIDALTEAASTHAYVYNIKADIKNGIYTRYDINFRVAPCTDGAAEEDVEDISIVTPPAKTVYYSGEYFNPAGLTLHAQLADGSTSEPFRECTWSPSGPLTLSDAEVVISYAGKTVTYPIEVIAANVMVDAMIREGDGYFIFKPYLLDENAYEVISGIYNGYSEKGRGKIIAPYGAPEVHIDIELPDDSVQVFIGETPQPVEGNRCSLTLPAGGATTVVTLKQEGMAPRDYEFICYSQRYADLPTAVVDYLSINSQYTNGGNGYNPSVGINAVATLRGAYGTATGRLEQPPFSLGNFGGYITYYYENAIKDDSKNPYGVDFVICGNSVDASNAFAEPGNVLVSEDGVTWYTLAGSLHYDNNIIWDYSITYTKNSGEKCDCVDSLGNSGTSGYFYPWKERYPLFPWTEELETRMTLTGVLLTPAAEVNEYGNTEPPFPDFGYTDVGILSSTNVADNPYTGTVYERPRTYNRKTDGFDLKWAVDGNGYPVSLPNGIHYIKVQTASSIINGGIGEKSTEINMMRIAAPTETDVGVSDAPSSIKVDGQEVTLSDGVYEYDVLVSGIFEVSVTAAEDANVYINGARTTVTNFEKIPNHGIIRVIVQDGEKAPQIYYLTLTDGGNGEAEPYTAVTFDANGGRVEGKLAITRYYDSNTQNTAFPIPVREGYTFLGWSSGQKSYHEYTSDMSPGLLTLTASWRYNTPPGTKPDDTIDVTFRLIGSTRSSEDVDLGKGDEGYYGTEYVTWIPTRGYSMTLGDTVYDLFVTALADAGLESRGADKNYVSMIKAPASLGGYKLSEFTNGEYSGWMYTVNGNHPAFGLREKDLKNGDKVIWHYVNDYRYEVSDWFDDPEHPSLGDGTYWNEWLKAKDADPDESNASGTAASPDSTTLAPKVTASKGVASVSLEASDINSAITDAKKNESKAIVIAPEITGTARKVSIELPKASLSSVASGTDADLTVKTPVGNVTIPNSVLESVASQASGSNVTVSLESVDKETVLTAAQKETVGDDSVYDVSILSGDKNISSFDGGSITISLPYTLKDGENPDGVTVWYLNDAGELEKMTCTYNKATGFATFTTDHLSYYVVGYSEAWTNPFTDVKNTDWFYGAVEFAVRNGLFNGVTDTTFSPNAQMTRAMLVTVLYRMDQAAKTVTVSTSATSGPAVTGGAVTAEKPEAKNFTDVKDGQWYTDAVAWANANGIVTGMGGELFGTGNNVTREQMAAILYNYAKCKGYDVAETAELNVFTDAKAVSGWAQPGIKWANAEGLITGRTATALAPGGSASRAEVAIILKRFVEGIAEE